jgi:broad specificity phosphatase PhoE
MKRLALSVLLSCLFVFAVDAQSIVFIVRHAEKAESKSNDPELSETGHTRAEALAKMLMDAGITGIYATDFKRTQQTAAPLATMLGLSVTSITGNDFAGLALKLRNQKGNALVVGHSNTIPDLIKAIGIAAPIKIAENEYDDLFVVVLDERPRLIRLHYR